MKYKMKWIKAIYKVPCCRHFFFIVHSCSPDKTDHKQSLRNKQRKEYFEDIVSQKNYAKPTKDQLWTIRLIQECDFLSSLEQMSNKRLISSNQSFYSPEDMELLSINASKKNSRYDETYHTPKALSKISEQDIIEIYI